MSDSYTTEIDVENDFPDVPINDNDIVLITTDVDDMIVDDAESAIAEKDFSFSERKTTINPANKKKRSRVRKNRKNKKSESNPDNLKSVTNKGNHVRTQNLEYFDIKNGKNGSIDEIWTKKKKKVSFSLPPNERNLENSSEYQGNQSEMSDMMENDKHVVINGKFINKINFSLHWSVIKEQQAVTHSYRQRMIDNLNGEICGFRKDIIYEVNGENCFFIGVSKSQWVIMKPTDKNSEKIFIGACEVSMSKTYVSIVWNHNENVKLKNCNISKDDSSDSINNLVDSFDSLLKTQEDKYDAEFLKIKKQIAETTTSISDLEKRLYSLLQDTLLKHDELLIRLENHDPSLLYDLPNWLGEEMCKRRELNDCKNEIQILKKEIDDINNHRGQLKDLLKRKTEIIFNLKRRYSSIDSTNEISSEHKKQKAISESK